MEHVLAPSDLKVTKRQARHLSKLTRISADELEGQRVVELQDAIGLRLDPQMFVLRRICGRVVKKNQVTGELEGVPNATVHVEDTDCSFVGYFPKRHPYFWLYHFRCTTEEIGKITTDECGEFCVWVPRWDVDRYLTWRRRFRCHFVRPKIRDVFEVPKLRRVPEIPRPFPLPDPPPFRINRHLLDSVRGTIRANVAERLEEAASPGGLEAPVEEGTRLMSLPLFPRRVQPPLPRELQDFDRLRETLPLDEEIVAELEPHRYVGPFLRCHLEWEAEWKTFFDVPDLTFRVTQDVDGDGDEEVIYDEGFFDIRWDDTDTDDVVLEASSIAISSPSCDRVDIRCQDTPSIEAVGLMDLEPAYHDDNTGYARRINRPRKAPGLFSDPQLLPATAPYTHWLTLHGCYRIDDPSHYRLVYRFKSQPSDAFSAEQPFLGVSWTAPRQGPGLPIPFVPDSDGWYKVHKPVSDLVFPNWLFYWPTPAGANGIYQVRLELGKSGNNGIASQGFSAPRTFVVENQPTSVQFLEVRWRVDPSSSWSTAPILDMNDCPVITRKTGQDVELRVHWMATAPHLRSAALGFGGCGGGDPTPLTSLETRQHWHTGPNDNTVDRVAIYQIPANADDGCYDLSITAHGRQCNPAGVTGGPDDNWEINQTFGRRHLSRSISVVTSNSG